MTCAGVSAGYAHDRRGEGDRDAGLDRDMTRPTPAGSREQAEGCSRRRSGDPLIAMMEPADLRNRDDAATGWFHDSWLGTVVVQRLVGPRGVVVAAVAA